MLHYSEDKCVTMDAPLHLSQYGSSTFTSKYFTKVYMTMMTGDGVRFQSIH